MTFERPLKDVATNELQLELALRAGPRYKCMAAECGSLGNSAAHFDTCPACGRKGFLGGGFVRDPGAQQWKEWEARMVNAYRRMAATGTSEVAA